MTVYIAVFDKASYQISDRLFADITEYIDDNYAEQNTDPYQLSRKRSAIRRSSSQELEICSADHSLAPVCCSRTAPSLSEMLSEMDDSFAVTLLKLIDIKGITEIECYKKANVSKQTWYKIINEKNYKPSKNTVISFAIALKLSLEETKSLLATVGFTLSKSSKFDIIIEYFLIKKEYNIFTINETLFKFDQVCLGV